jgi:hypothetical protein
VEIVDDIVVIVENFGESDPVSVQGTAFAFVLAIVVDTGYPPRFLKPQRSVNEFCFEGNW